MKRNLSSAVVFVFALLSAPAWALNSPPPISANPDTATATQGVSVAIDVLANDTGSALVVAAVSPPAHGFAFLNAATKTVTYASAGNFLGTDTFTYTIVSTDLTAGVSASSTATVTVNVVAQNFPPPVANPDVVVVAKNSAAVPVNVLANDVGTSLKVTAVTQGINGGTVALIASNSANTVYVTYAPATNYSGSDRFTYTITDSRGATATGNVEVTVIAPNPPPAPIANPDTASVAKNSSNNPINVLANDVGTGLTVSAVTQGVNGGTVTLNSMAMNPVNTAALFYTPASNYAGTDRFTYTIKDANGATATANVDVLVVAPNPPPPPIANPDGAKVAKNSTANPINVLANDVGTGLRITAVTQGTNGGSVVILSTVAGANVAAGVAYTPASNYVGSDHFTYTITDANGATATGNVEVAVIAPAPPPPPVANADFATVLKNSSRNPINVLTNDVGTGLMVTAVTQSVQGGTVAILSSIVAANGAIPAAIVYTPATDYVGDDQFTYTITDSNGGTATAKVGILVVAPNPPPPPIANPDTVKVLKDSTANPINVLANDVGTGLTVTAVTQGVNGGTVTLIVTVAANPGNVAPIAYTPPASYTGPDHFTYTIVDANGASATGIVEVAVVAPAPPPPPIANPDTAVVGRNTSNNPINVLLNDIGTRLTITAVSPCTNGGTVTLAASGAVNAPGLTYTPAANYLGSDHFTYTITDGNGATATADVEIIIVALDPPPPGPIANPDTATVAKDSSKNVIEVLANDIGTGLTITAVTQGANGAVAILSASTANGNAVSYTPAAGYAGTDHFTYTITDSRGASATGNVAVLVQAPKPPPAPVANPDVATVLKNSTNNPINVLANDVGTGLTISAVTQGTHGGTVTILNTIQANAGNPVNMGGVAYSPALDYTGSDNFTYTITDSTGASATGNVEVLVVAPPPPPPPPPAIQANPDFAKVLKNSPANPINVLLNDIGTNLTISAVTQGAHGTVAIVVPPTANAGALGSVVTYTPALDYSGPDEFTYSITDNNGATATGKVSVYVSDTTPGPVANPDFATTPKNSAGVDIDVLSNDIGNGLTITAFTQGKSGAVSASAAGNGLTYIPAANFAGMDYFTYTVSDANGATAIGNVSVLVASPKPVRVACTASPSSVVPGGTVAFFCQVSDVSSTAVLAFSWDFGDGNTSALRNPTHAYAAAGVYTATVNVSSGNTVIGSASVMVKVQGGTGAPTAIFTISAGLAVAGSPITFDGSASTDPANSIASYAWDFGDSSPLGNTAVVTHTYTAPGAYTVTLTVTNAQGVTGSVAHIVQVLVPPPTAKQNFRSHVHYVAKLDLVNTGTDSLVLGATLNVGTTVVSAGTPVAVVIAGQSFAGTLDSKLQDSSSPNERWQVRTMPGASGNILLTLSAKKTTLAAAFTAAGAVPPANAAYNTPVALNIPVTISVGGQDVPLMITTYFTFARGTKASAIGDGP